METKDMALIIGGLATAGIGGYFLWNYLKEEPSPPLEGVDIVNIKII